MKTRAYMEIGRMRAFPKFPENRELEVDKTTTCQRKWMAEWFFGAGIFNDVRIPVLTPRVRRISIINEISNCKCTATAMAQDFPTLPLRACFC